MYIEITSYPGVADARPFVWAYATRADRRREQLTHAQRYTTWEDALAVADAWRRDAEAFLRDPFHCLLAWVPFTPRGPMQ